MNFYTNDTAHGVNELWSDLTNQLTFKNQQVCFPVITIHTQTNNQSGAIRTKWLTPHEMGSYGPRLNAMVPTKYLGTHLKDDGTPDVQTPSKPPIPNPNKTPSSLNPTSAQHPASFQTRWALTPPPPPASNAPHSTVLTS
ncbi:hypothetical protein M422DRAFT_275311 [Sphaerobolus stellatus SS14]|uniref:Lysophospholipase n=1 Tax=Sphaerobolus stellatus (strain SS14) TaxID=990650 RepID=A0A0C9T580_SPHS4|nr:hypothetical protein M422DRAFT_275311 [Sphaerobolus stellatus SS14]